MNVKNLIDKNIDFNLTKRNNCFAFIQKEVLGEEYSPDKMVLGDISWAFMEKYFLDKIAYRDNVYYLFAINHNSNDSSRGPLYTPMISSKDDNNIPKEVQDILYNTIYPQRMKEFVNLQKEAFEEKNKIDKGE